MKKSVTYTYSEAFKLQLVREIESGKFASCHEAAARYGLKGSRTIYNWVRKYGKNNLIRKVVHVKTLSERDEMKKLRNRVRELEKLVADQQLDLAIERNFLKILCRETKTDIDEFKKNTDGNAPIKL